jgi:hypothetical protein
VCAEVCPDQLKYVIEDIQSKNTTAKDMENSMITGNADIIRALMATKKISKDKRARTIHLLKNQKTPKKATKRQMEEAKENELLRAKV